MQVSTDLSSALGDIARTSDEAQTAIIAVDASETDYHFPEINAYDAAVVSGQPVVLEASANDADFDLIQFNWRQLAGPTITTTDADSTTISFVVPEVASATKLIFELTAADSQDVISSIVTLTVPAVETKPDEDLHRHSGSFSWLAFLFGSLYRFD
ncbi:hypothetical protein A9Q98_05595 [Thalassotalea sp. 42_200_T64]|nr:hypothetical protein A9Q98_05595 [Thalassotalea sp. 42_200_T64]